MTQTFIGAEGETAIPVVCVVHLVRSLRHKTIAALLILVAATSIVLSVPLAPLVHGALVGVVCVAPSTPHPSTSCPQNPFVFTGGLKATFVLAVNINGSDALSGFEMYIKTNNTGVLSAAAATSTIDLSGSILPPATRQILALCINGTPVVGASPCTAQDGAGIVHLGAGASGFLSSPPSTGHLFNITYTTGRTVGTASLGYQTGCTTTSVKGTTDCVVVTGTSLAIPETDQSGSFTNAGPGANFRALPGSGPAPLTSNFDGSTSFFSAPATSITAYHWNFADGNTLTTATATTSHVYVTPGNFTPSLTVTDSASVTSNPSKGLIIMVRAIPSLGITLNSTSIAVNGTVHASTVLTSGTSSASGTVKYTVYENGVAGGCTGTVISTSTVFVTAGVIPNSADVQFTAADYFSWQAVYSGNANNNPATSSCVGLLVGGVSPLISVVTGGDGNLYSSRFTGAWSSWQILNGWSPSPPSLCAVGGGTKVELVVQGADSAIYLKTFSAGAWSATWNKNPSGVTTMQPVCAVLGTTLHVVVVGSTGELWDTTFDTTAQTWAASWTDLSGFTPSVPALAATPSLSRLDLVVRGTDNQIYHKAFTGTWAASWDTSNRQPVKDKTVNTPAIVSDGTNLNVVVIGSDFNLYYATLTLATNSWSTYTKLNGWTGGGSLPVLVIDSAGTLHLVVTGANGAVYEKAKPAGLSWDAAWTSAGGITTGTPGVTVIGTSLAVVQTGIDGRIWFNGFTAGVWSGWSFMNGTASRGAPSVSPSS